MFKIPSVQSSQMFDERAGVGGWRENINVREGRFKLGVAFNPDEASHKVDHHIWSTLL
jgi:hypothetical protein